MKIDIKRRTGKEWCDDMEISIVGDLMKGFCSIETFEKDPITRTEFCCRISRCKLLSNKFKSDGQNNRREASKMRSALRDV